MGRPKIITKEDVLISEKISRTINRLKTKGSKDRYKYFICEFFKFINESPDTYFIDDYEFLEPIDKKKASKRYKRNLEDFKIKLMNEPNKYGRDNKSSGIRTFLASIKSFFVDNEIDLPIAFWSRLIDFKNFRVSKTKTPTSEELRRILDNTDIQGKSIFLIMGTSGSRITSVLNLRRKDIDINHTFPRVTFYYKTSKDKRTKVKRVSSECKRFLESYFIKNNFNSNDYIFPNPKNSNKPMTKENATFKWNCALKKSGLYELDENTGRSTMTLHCLKRFFKSNFRKAEFNNNERWEDFFAEHNENLDSRYIEYDDKYIDEQYSKGVKFLLVYEKSYDTDFRIKQLQKEKDELLGKVKVLSDRTKLYENKFTDIDVKFKNIENILNDSLNPDNLQLQNNIKLVKDFMPTMFNMRYGRDITEEELEKCYHKFDKLFPKVTEEITQLQADKKLKLSFNEINRIIDKKMKKS